LINLSIHLDQDTVCVRKKKPTHIKEQWMSNKLGLHRSFPFLLLERLCSRPGTNTSLVKHQQWH